MLIVTHSIDTCHFDPSNHPALALALLLGQPVLHLSSETQSPGKEGYKKNSVLTGRNLDQGQVNMNEPHPQEKDIIISKLPLDRCITE